MQYGRGFAKELTIISSSFILIHAEMNIHKKNSCQRLNILTHNYNLITKNVCESDYSLIELRFLQVI